MYDGEMAHEGRDAGVQAVDGFCTTPWTVVFAAARPGPEAREALDTICELYWPPIHGYIRRRGYAAADSEDLAQEFFTRLLETHTVGRADPRLGTFRAYLLGALKYFLAGQHARAGAQKRGGGCRLLSITKDGEGKCSVEEPTGGPSPEAAYEREWGLRILELALDSLRGEFVADGKEAIFEHLVPCISGGDCDATYRELGARLGMTEGAVKVAVHRVRRRYREAVRQQIGRTVGSPSDIDEEIRHLFAALRA
jgi:RNA polymerase sigma-70 factor (ECF subfamily)